MLRLPVGVLDVGLAGSGSNSPWVAGADVAGGSSASIFDDAGWISVEGPAHPMDGGRPKRDSEASREDGLADLPCASRRNADSGSSRRWAKGGCVVKKCGRSW